MQKIDLKSSKNVKNGGFWQKIVKNGWDIFYGGNVLTL